MYNLTKKYQYKVFKRLLETKESFKDACSKSGLTFSQGKQFLSTC